jgi:peptidoglycan-N-acetylglucosamine deacetylase
MTPRCTVCLSFDVDGFSSLLFDGVATTASLSRGEFDVRTGLPRLMCLLDRFGLPATFFVPGHTAVCFPDEVRAIGAAGHELAHHGFLHEPPGEIDREAELLALQRGTAALEEVAGVRPVGYRAPAWEPSSSTIELLEQLSFAYDSSLFGSDIRPYFARAGDEIDAESAKFGRTTSVVEIPVSWSREDGSYFANQYRPGGSGTTPPSHVRELWSETVAYAVSCDEPTVVVFTMHPPVSGQGYVLRMLEGFWGELAASPDVRFATLRDTAEEWRARLEQ